MRHHRSFRGLALPLRLATTVLVAGAVIAPGVGGNAPTATRTSSTVDQAPTAVPAAAAGTVSIAFPRSATPGHLVPITVTLPSAVAAVEGRVMVADGAAELIGVAPAGGGSILMPVPLNPGYAFGAYGMRGSTSGNVLTLLVNPIVSGRIRVSVSIDAAASALGERLQLLGTVQSGVLAAGAATSAIGAPGLTAAANPGAGHAARGPLGRPTISAEDVDALRQAWQSARARGRACAPERATDDANGDGCVDIVDLQATLAANGKPNTTGTATTSGMQLAAFETPATAASVPAALARSTAILTATFAHVFTVTTTADTNDATPGDAICADANGDCSLRAAITEANWSTGLDEIAFNLPGTAPVTIQLTSRLPSITSRAGGVVIDAYTQPGSSVNTATVGSNAVPGVELRGNGPTAGEVGFYITSPGNTVRGFWMDNLWRGFFIDGTAASGNTIVGNIIGFNRDGTPGGSFASGGEGIVNDTGANHNQIGAPALADRNVVANFVKAIYSYGPGTDYNVVQNNVLCLRPTGLTGVASCTIGIDHDFGPKYELDGGTGAQRNVIGRTANQCIEFSHGWNPVDASTGPLPGDYTDTYAIRNNQAVGNWVGFRADGSYDPYFVCGYNQSTSDNGNAINVYDGTPDNIIDGNTIASAYDGIQVEEPHATGNIVRNNVIGVSPLGEPAPLAWWGIKLRWGTSGDLISSNTIRNVGLGGIGLLNTTNTGAGISTAFNVKLTHNIVTNTSGPAILLQGDANASVKPPTITSATVTSVSGTGAVSGATIELYHATLPVGLSGLPDAFIGTAVAASDGSWTVSQPAGLNVGDSVTALQIRPDTNTSALSTNAAVTSGGGTDSTIASDTYSRTLSSGWGSADVGGPWTVNASSGFAVDGSSGILRLSSAGITRIATLGSVNAADVDISVDISPDQVPTGNSTFLYVVGRHLDASNEYRVQVRLATDGSVNLLASRVVGGTQAAIGSEVRVSGLTLTGGDSLTIHATFSGAGPTTIRARAYFTGTTEPTTWQVTQTDSSSALQGAGAVGLRGYLSSGATNAPITISVDNLKVVPAA